MKARISQLIEQLRPHCGRSERQRTIDGVAFSRIGRNDVWQFQIADLVLYATLCRSDEEFRRRLSGIEVSTRLASQHDFIAAAVQEAVIDDQRAIVTRRVAGTPVHHLLQRGYRIDKNPFRLLRHRQPLHRAVSRIAGFLGAMHALEDVPHDKLWDHRLPKVLRRVRQNLDLTSRDCSSLRGLTIPDGNLPTEPPSQLIMGDATLSNFLFDGQRIACVDYEDLGLGEARRDFIILAESTDYTLGKWHYWNDGVSRLIPHAADNDPLAQLYRLDAQLFRVLRAIRMKQRPQELRHEAQAARQQIFALAASQTTACVAA